MSSREGEVVGAFSEEVASRLSGVSITQLRMWDRTGFFVPSYAESNRRLPYSRIYSFRDLVSLRVLGRLRNEFKVPLQHLRKVSEKLSSMGDDRWTACTLYVLGKRVVFADPRTQERQDVVSGQRVFDIPLRVAISDTRKAITELNRPTKRKAGEITHNKFIMQNEPVFEGTRIPVATVQRYLAAGYEPAQIIAEFPDLTVEDITAAESYKGKTHAA